jgi:hypothetical protein
MKVLMYKWISSTTFAVIRVCAIALAQYAATVTACESLTSQEIDTLAEDVRAERRKIETIQLEVDLIIDSLADESTQTRTVRLWANLPQGQTRVDTLIPSTGGDYDVDARCRGATEFRGSIHEWLSVDVPAKEAGIDTQFHLGPKVFDKPSSSYMFIVQDPRVIGLISNDFDGLRYNTLQERIVAVQGTSTASMDSVSLEGEDCKLVSSDRTLTDAATGNIRNVRMRVWLIQRDSRLLFRRSETEYSTTDSGGVPQNSRYQIDVDHAKHELTDIWVPTKYVIEKRAGGVDNYRETALINVIRLNNGFDGDPFSLKSMEHLKPGAHGLSSKGWIEWDGSRLKPWSRRSSVRADVPRAKSWRGWGWLVGAGLLMIAWWRLRKGWRPAARQS